MTDFNRKNAVEVLEAMLPYLDVKCSGVAELRNNPKNLGLLTKLSTVSYRMNVAIETFTELGDYKDSAVRLEMCRENLSSNQVKVQKRKRRRIKAMIAIVILFILSTVVLHFAVPPIHNYIAESKFDEGKYESAASCAGVALDYDIFELDFENWLSVCEKIEGKAKQYLSEGDYEKAYNIIEPIYLYNQSTSSIIRHLYNGEYKKANDYYEIKELTLPNNKTMVSMYMLQDCDEIETIIIPEGVTYIGDNAFSRCKSLKTIIIPNTVESIGPGAFSNCSSLEKVIIPASVESIGYHAFIGCNNVHIYTPNKSRPKGWGSDWNIIYDSSYDKNDKFAPVTWGYTGE